MTVLFLLTSIFGQQVWYFNVGDWSSTQIIEIFIYGIFFLLKIFKYIFSKFIFYLVFALGLSLPFSIYNMYK